MNATQGCNDERRRMAVRRADLNGIDYVEVSDDQRTISVFLLGKAPQDVTVANIRIDGGRRVTGIRVVDLRLCIEDDPDLDDCLRVVVDRPGDFSTYTLRLVNADARGRPGNTPLDGFDPRYARIDFSFKAGCPSDLDCAPTHGCPPETLAEPEISYLAKDYTSFRQLILDRLALIMPGWTERHAPDLGIALVELLAYVGDHLSYYQDAVATEAYLDTARQRISVRRHARLVNYLLHEGINARTWVCVATDTDIEGINPEDIFFITGRDEDLPSGARMLGLDDLRNVPAGRYEVFEPVVRLPPVAPVVHVPSPPELALAFYQAHTTIRFYTWGDRACCLARGATAATLRDAYVDQPPGPVDPEAPKAQSPVQQQPPAQTPQPGQRPTRLKLKAGDVLILEEVRGPATGLPEDADPTRRHAVRLTQVEYAVDALYDQPVVEIAWDAVDALPFSLCLSAIGRAPECAYLEDVSIARGNVLLVDHGATVRAEPLPPVPAVQDHSAGCVAEGEPRLTPPVPPPYRARLRQGPLTHRAPFPAPVDVARRQGLLLRGILERVRAQATELLALLHAGQTLSEQQASWLRLVFPAAAVERSRLFGAPRGPRRPSPPEQARALAWLVARFDTLLAKKARRLALLAARAEGGVVLTAQTVAEVAALFGAPFAQGLNKHNPGLAGPASGALQQEPTAALPDLSVAAGQTEGAVWLPRMDLLGSGPDDRHLVAEIDDAGRALLRFGDDSAGRAPEPGVQLFATYRIGNGTAGNVGAETIRRIVFRNARPEGARLEPFNPLPAVGGRDPQPVAEAKLLAPGAFRSELRRAITGDDYARLAERGPGVQRATARLRWGGSWYEARVALDPSGSQQVDSAMLEAAQRGLEPYRRIGHDLTVWPARYVPLHIALTVCVRPVYQRGHVKAALLDALGNRVLAGGRRGFFHPDALTFGGGIALSQIVAAALAVEGVETVALTRFERRGQGDNGELLSGFLPIRPDEIARLDNDPNTPENGTLTLTLRGGR
ncbi:MAG: hypothetical protein OHK0022_31650 [Roseiflexaceae bacterium]